MLGALYSRYRSHRRAIEYTPQIKSLNATLFLEKQVQQLAKILKIALDIKIDELDFNYEYSHENPFPVHKVDSKLVDSSYNMVFSKVSDFFNRNITS